MAYREMMFNEVVVELLEDVQWKGEQKQQSRQKTPQAIDPQLIKTYANDCLVVIRSLQLFPKTLSAARVVEHSF